MKILFVKGSEILDSRGNPTIETTVILEDGSKGEFKVPSGASTGIHEAHELRDGEKRFDGKGVKKAVQNIERIANHIEGKEFSQKELDDTLIQLDGTKNKELLGANAILGVSVSFAKACAKSHNFSLHEYLHRIAFEKDLKIQTNQEKPNVHLFANLINGGLHAGNGLNIQEFMVIPNFKTNQENIEAVSAIYHKLKSLISQNYGPQSTSVGDEGGFAPNISEPVEALDLLSEATKQAGFKKGIYFAIDAAASDFYDSKNKKYELFKGEFYDYKQLSQYYNKLVENYPLISIEDPFSEDDFEGFTYFMKNLPNLGFVNPLSRTRNQNPLVVGDDLLVTNPSRIETAQKQNLCNSLLLKINQIGTLSEAIQAFSMAELSNWHTIVSHRSGETTDDFISDLSYALNSSLKLGSPARGERVAKYNRLLKILN